MTSQSAKIRVWPVEVATSTPVARPPSNTMRVTRDLCQTVGSPRSASRRKYRALLAASDGSAHGSPAQREFDVFAQRAMSGELDALAAEAEEAETQANEGARQ